MGKKKAAKAATKKKPDEEAAAAPKPPAEPTKPFGPELPNAENFGSPADGNWKPTGQQEQDVATLEAQERYLYRLMNKSKAMRDLAKAQAKVSIAEAEETNVSDGFAVEEKIRLHKLADTHGSRALKAEKEYKRAREGWNSVKHTLHRYLTEPERPLFDKGRNKKSAAA